MRIQDLFEDAGLSEIEALALETVRDEELKERERKISKWKAGGIIPACQLEAVAKIWFRVIVYAETDEMANEASSAERTIESDSIDYGVASSDEILFEARLERDGALFGGLIEAIQTLDSGGDAVDSIAGAEGRGASKLQPDRVVGQSRTSVISRLRDDEEAQSQETLRGNADRESEAASASTGTGEGASEGAQDRVSSLDDEDLDPENMGKVAEFLEELKAKSEKARLAKKGVRGSRVFQLVGKRGVDVALPLAHWKPIRSADPVDRLPRATRGGAGLGPAPRAHLFTGGAAAQAACGEEAGLGAPSHWPGRCLRALP
eukprot:scaffold3731_cov381-Prasinococcus_capsulatus_cf.AAC.7